MFQIIWSCISQLWDLFCESISSTNTSQARSSSVASTITSQAPSSSVSDSVPSKTSSQTQYDVFLSFRGKDTRLNFTGHLYDKLDSNGIRTFMDDPELRSGQVISDALLDAIRKSKSYVVVFSKNFASSSWCLDELVEIFNCHKTAQRSIIPVFYKIDPSVVRHQIGSFKQAFKKHQVRVEMEKVNIWRLALTQVADLSGLHISENTPEADIINQIVDEIMPKIDSKVLDVAKYPVGLESRVKALTALLNSHTEEGFTKIGLYGMGGVGKTTLAKALFNQLLRRESFQGSCFLSNVREVSGTFKGVQSLQQRFINSVLKSRRNIAVDNVEEGIMLIKERICSSKVLLLIDDIDDPKQYESLIGSFASGSVVIATTRDQEILDKIEVEPKFQYRVNELDDAESLALFTRHAFRNAEQNNTLMALSKYVLHHAAGLPLALEVFGSYLYNQSEVGWKSYIEKLERVPNNTIQQKLIISLNAIELDDPMLKNIFLDIACFFIGWGIEGVVKIMETYYYCADHKIEILKKRCLVKITYNALSRKHELDMHDLLRDVGRNVTRSNAPDEPGKYSRLWLPNDIVYVLKNHKGTEVIEGIIPEKRNYQNALEGNSFTTEAFKWMSKLRFLYFNKVNLTGSFEQIFEDLRVLRWDCCPLKCLPFDFHPKKLVILELKWSNMRTMWGLNMVSPVFEKLKTLNMSYSQHLIETPDFNKLPCLETLDLEGCNNLEEVHMSIGCLVSLVSLNLRGCEKLRSLPDTICNLRALRVLTISECRRLTVLNLPDSIGHLTNLVELDLSNNKNLETLPDTICNLRSLEILNIDRCSWLQALPTEIGNIESLKKLNVEGLAVSKLPDSIGCLSKIVKLNLSYNKKLETLPDTICNMRSLEILNIEGCSGLQALPMEIGNINSLRKINVKGLTVSKFPDSIGHLSKIVVLDISHNEKLETLPDTICNLRSLETLIFLGCKNLEILPDQLWKITRLRELHAFGSTMLKKLPDIGSSQIAVSLQKMNFNESGITALPSGFSQLSGLQHLDLGFCVHLFSIPELPPNLKKIFAYECTSLQRLPNLSNLKHLETLDLQCCTSLTEIHGLEELTALRELNLRYCSGFTHIQGLTSITVLKLGDPDSLVAYDHLTKRLLLAYMPSNPGVPRQQWINPPLVLFNRNRAQIFEIYSEFGHQICVYVQGFLNWESYPQWPNWITELPYWTSESSNSSSTTVYAHLLPNQSHNFTGIILCFKESEDCKEYTFCYSVKNTRSGFTRSDSLSVPCMKELLMVIVPKLIFPVTYDDHRIELTADSHVKIVGIHLLYNTEIKMIEDVVKKHVIDIDALNLIDPVLQDIFLYIACFSLGRKKEEVVQILETYYTNLDHYIDVLEKRCLVRINDDDELEMDDLLRHIGRKIASKTSIDELGRHCGKWLSADIHELFKKHKGDLVYYEVHVFDRQM